MNKSRLAKRIKELPIQRHKLLAARMSANVAENIKNCLNKPSVGRELQFSNGKKKTWDKKNLLVIGCLQSKKKV